MASRDLVVPVALRPGGSTGDLTRALAIFLLCLMPLGLPPTTGSGGTTLAGSGTTISSEVVWNETANQEGATGGGVSVAAATTSRNAPTRRTTASRPAGSASEKTSGPAAIVVRFAAAPVMIFPEPECQPFGT